MTNLNVAAVCGLFCGTCPSFIGGECGGCLSQNCCCDCFNGFKDCAKTRQICRCYECNDFPCEKLHDFSKKHIVNGVGHHLNVISDLKQMQSEGVETWVQEQTRRHTCEKCGQLKVWYGTHSCDSGDKPTE